MGGVVYYAIVVIKWVAGLGADTRLLTYSIERMSGTPCFLADHNFDQRNLLDESKNLCVFYTTVSLIHKDFFYRKKLFESLQMCRSQLIKPFFLSQFAIYFLTVGLTDCMVELRSAR